MRKSVKEARAGLIPSEGTDALTARQGRIAIGAPEVTAELDARELATVLAALRYWQSHTEEASKQSPSQPRRRGVFGDIATNMGEFEPLSDKEIEALCVELNWGRDK